MQKKIVIALVAVLVAFLLGGLTGLAAAYIVTGEQSAATGKTAQIGFPANSTDRAGAVEAAGTMPEEENKQDQLEDMGSNPRGTGGDHDLGEAAPGENDSGNMEEPILEPGQVAAEQQEEQAQEPEPETEAPKKVAYLTIDDGPDPENTPAILKILRDYQVKATFFVIGTSIEKHPELLQKIYEEGHLIGNHTYNHVYKDIYASDASFLDSIKKNEELIYNLIEERPVIIREPGGRFRTRPEKQKMLAEAGYALVGWNIDSYDSRKPIPNAETILDNVSRQAAKEQLRLAMVILFHESRGHRSTVEALPSVIEFLTGEGFEFRTLEEMDEQTMADLPRP